MTRFHRYRATITWTGNLGTGTENYRAYSRNHDVSVEGKPVIAGSSDSSFKGDSSRHTPEDLLVCSLSECHMLWYLHLCAVNGVVVIAYNDNAEGEMLENQDGSGQFQRVTLHPHVVVANQTMLDQAKSLHVEANRLCFIARSVNFPVSHEPHITCPEEA